MATTLRTDVIIPELLQEAIKSAFAGLKCLNGSAAAIVRTGLPGDARGGDAVKIPYFGNLGELEDVAENVALTPVSISQSSETATVQRAGKAFEATRWAQNAAASDPYAEAARQLREMVERRADKALIDVAVASSGLPSTHVIDVFNAGSPALLTYDRVVDSRMAFGDEGGRIALLAIHSKVYGDLLKTKDADGRPLMLPSMASGDFGTFAGIPVHVSDRCPVEFPSITAAGTTPPAVTVTGSTTMAIRAVLLDIVAGGALATATVRYSFDGGNTWSATVATAASLPLLRNGSPTGLTATFAAGTYNADNTYTGVAKFTSVICRPGSLALWLTETPRVDADRDILADKDVTAVHMYFAAHRYSRLPGSLFGGVALIKTN